MTGEPIAGNPMSDELIERVQMQRQLEAKRALSAKTACERNSASYREQLLFDVLARISRPSITADAVAGWRLVPLEATDAMDFAGGQQVDHTNPYQRDVAINVWSAMLAAAPTHEGALQMPSREWLREKIEADPDVETDAGGAGDTEPGDLVERLTRRSLFDSTGLYADVLRALTSLRAERDAAQSRYDSTFEQCTVLVAKLKAITNRAEAAEQRVAALEGAVGPLRHYAEMRLKQPLKGLGDSVHMIHASTEYEAELKFSDILAVLAALRPAETGEPT